MSYTKFGEFVRILRIKNHEIMGDMAEFLDTLLSFFICCRKWKKKCSKGLDRKNSLSL